MQELQETPPFMLFSDQILELAQSKQWKHLSPMQHILGASYAVGQIATSVQVATDKFHDEQAINDFLQTAIAGNSQHKTSNISYPTIEWRPTEEAKLPPCTNCSKHELQPIGLDQENSTIHAMCQFCETPHSVIIVPQGDNNGSS